MRVSVIIPAKNEERYLPLLLASLRGQTVRDFEIVVADAGSTDHTVQLAEAAGARVVPGGLPGPGRNRGAKQAKGDLFCFFDADVLLPHPNFLQDCLREFQERALDVATCSLTVQDGTLLDHALHGAYNKYSEAVQPLLPHAPGCCIFAKRAVHEAIGGFDESVVFAEDHDYARRADKAGYATGILKSHKIAISPRRYRKDGMMRTAAKFVWTEAAILMRGPFKSLPFKYDFGEYDSEAEDVSTEKESVDRTR